MVADYKHQRVTPIMWNCDGAAIVAGTTTTFACGSVSAAESRITVPVPRDGIVRNMTCYINAPAGLGETVTFTFRLAFGNTLLTVTIGGAVDQQGDDMVNAVAVAKDDLIDIMVVTSVACAAVRVSVGFDFIPS